jgi:hypothetical protein
MFCACACLRPSLSASAYAVLKIMLEEDIVGRCAKMEPIMQAEMAKLADK